MRLALAAAVLLATPLAAQEAGLTPTDLDVLRARELLIDGDAQAAADALRPAAEAGNPRAQALYGTIWDFGDLGTVDAKEAIRWYEAAAGQGYAPAYTFLGQIHRYGTEGLDPDPQTARDWFERGIAADHYGSFGELADMLMFGEELPHDFDLALLLARRGAYAGDALSATVLGRALRMGLGTEADEEAARRNYLIGAAGDNAISQNDLAYMALNGAGGPVDVPLAQEMLRRAMGQGLDIAGQTMSELLLAHPDLASGPLDAAAHCVWATDPDLATWQWSPADDPWRTECADLLAPLTPEERAEAERLAATLTPAD